MEVSLRNLKSNEAVFAFSDEKLEGYSGFIGYLRADFDSNGESFFTTWFGCDKAEKENNEIFKKTIDDLVNSLRAGDNLLSSRNCMKDYCENHLTATLSGFSEDFSYGFRADAGDYAFIFRCTPMKGWYDLYLYCYQKDLLDKFLEKSENGIRFITPHYKSLFRIEDGDSIIIKSNNGVESFRCRFVDESHFYCGLQLYHICEFAEKMEASGAKVEPEKVFLPEVSFFYEPLTELVLRISKNSENAKVTTFSESYVEELNQKKGVSEEQAKAMQAGFTRGWCSKEAHIRIDKR